MILEAKNLGKTYRQANGEKLSILKNLNINIGSEKTVSIMGQSGCGKSTLLSILAGLDKPTEGSVQVLGTDLYGVSDQQLTRFRTENVGIVFQRFHLLPHLTALENVVLPLEFQKNPAAESEAKTALERVGLGHRLDHYPHQMSRGECQRVAIARVIVMKPKIIFADEPTGSLDEQNAKEVMQYLFDLAKEQKSSFVLVTHDASLGKLCDEQYRIQDGQVTCVSPQ